MQRRWQRFGIDATRLRHTLANCREFLANPVPYDRRPGGDSSWRLAIADRTMLGVLGWLEYSTRTDKLEDWRERAAEVPR